MLKEKDELIKQIEIFNSKDDGAEVDKKMQEELKTIELEIEEITNKLKELDIDTLNQKIQDITNSNVNLTKEKGNKEIELKEIESKSSIIKDKLESLNQILENKKSIQPNNKELEDKIENYIQENEKIQIEINK